MIKPKILITCASRWEVTHKESKGWRAHTHSDSRTQPHALSREWNVSRVISRGQAAPQELPRNREERARERAL